MLKCECYRHYGWEGSYHLEPSGWLTSTSLKNACKKHLRVKHFVGFSARRLLRVVFPMVRRLTFSDLFFGQPGGDIDSCELWNQVFHQIPLARDENVSPCDRARILLGLSTSRSLQVLSSQTCSTTSSRFSALLSIYYFVQSI